MTNTFIQCVSSTEGVLIEHDRQDSLYYIGFYKHSPYKFRISWRDRLRYIWKLFTTGIPYNDQIILGVDEARKLVSFLCNTTPEIQTNTKTFTDDELYTAVQHGNNI